MRKQIMKKGLACYSLTLFIALVVAMAGLSQGELIHADGNVTLIEGSAYFAVENASDGSTATLWVTDAVLPDYHATMPDPILVFDLGEDVIMDAVGYANYSITNANGVSQFSLRFAKEADGPDGFGTSVTSNPRIYVELLDPSIIQVKPLGTIVTARYIEMTCEDNFYTVEQSPPGGDRDGFAELQFNKTVPEKAWEPSPGLQAEDVDVNVTLSWKAAMIVDPVDPNAIIPDPTLITHQLYMSSGDPEDPNVFHFIDIDAGDPVNAEVSYGPISLARDKTYYWRVDEVTDSNTVTGDTWYFSTLTSTPEIDDATPADAAVFAGEEVSFTVVAINPFSGDSTGLSYQWYKDEGGGTPVGTDSDTYTIASASDSDVGGYYCIVTITTPDVGTTATSRTASLLIKKLIGHWPFDEDLTDIVGGYDGTYEGTGKEKYEAGIVAGGQAVFFPTGSNPVTIPTTASTELSWTISWWENSDPASVGGDWETMVGCGAGPDGWEVFEFGRTETYRYAFGILGNYIWTPTDSSLYPRGTWHFMVVAYDPSTRVTSWYINGELAYTFGGVAFESFDTVFYIGNVRGLSQPYVGLIDDLRLYNYPIDAFEVAGLYTDVMGGQICVGNPAYDITGPEGEPDCVIDINDFVEFITQWLDHGYYPYRP